MEVTLRAEPRSQAGSRVARRLRREGKVPAVLYGRDTEPEPLVVDAHELAVALHTEAGSNVLINLEVDGESHLTLPREVQRNPLKEEFLHVDFMRISRTEAVEVEVPLHLEGTPQPVSEGLAVTEQIRGSVRVSALPQDLPPQVALDISGLELHEVLRIEDLPALSGVTYLDDPEDPVVTVAVPRMEIPEPEEVEEELPEELAELAEGEEPPAEEAEGAEEADEDQG